MVCICIMNIWSDTGRDRQHMFFQRTPLVHEIDLIATFRERRFHESTIS